jgi:cytochrome c oxidase subunit 3
MPRTAFPEVEVLPQVGGPSAPPPPDRGGGGGDQPHGRRGPRQRLKRYRFMLALCVFAITLLFLTITYAYVMRRYTGRFDSLETGNVADWVPLALPLLLWINTGLLAISSATSELARRRIFAEHAVMREWLGWGTPARNAALPWMGITVLLGFGFLIGQYALWRQFLAEGAFSNKNPAGVFFIMITVTHAVHLLGGVIGILWAGLSNLLMRPLENRQIAVDISTWYWHAMGLIWAYIVGVLVIMN